MSLRARADKRPVRRPVRCAVRRPVRCAGPRAALAGARPLPVAALRAGVLRARLVPVLLAAFVAGAVVTGARPARADPIRDAQWHLDDLRLPVAWEISRGRGVTIAILDTGVDPRADSTRGRVRTGPDFVKSGARRGDKYWGRHGTDMATVAAGAGRRPGAPNGILGVAPEARILSVRVIAENEDPEFGDAGSTAGVAQAIRYAVDHGAQVISMSFGQADRDATPGERLERAAIRYAVSRGVVVVASAGNDGDPKSRPRRGRNRVGFPAGYAGVIAVGAAGRNHAPATFSTKHTYVTIAAPGVGIVERADASFYYLGEGTSQAAAVVAGTVALIKAANPKLSPAQIHQLLVETASHRPKGGHSAGLGFGIVNPLAALRQAAKLTPQPQQATARPYDGPAYFGAGPERPKPVGAARSSGILGGRSGRRLLLGGLGLALLLPAPWLLLGGGRMVAAARRRRDPAATADAVPDAASAAVTRWWAAHPGTGGSAAWTPPAQRDADQRAQRQGDQQRQPQWHRDDRNQEADRRQLPVLKYEHQRHGGDDQQEHMPPAEGPATPGP